MTVTIKNFFLDNNESGPVIHYEHQDFLANRPEKTYTKITNTSAVLKADPKDTHITSLVCEESTKTIHAIGEDYLSIGNSNRKQYVMKLKHNITSEVGPNKNRSQLITNRISFTFEKPVESIEYFFSFSLLIEFFKTQGKSVYQFFGIDCEEPQEPTKGKSISIILILFVVIIIICFVLILIIAFMVFQKTKIGKSKSKSDSETLSVAFGPKK